MPYHLLDPELCVEHEGVAVYHCYDDDSMVSTYWYTTDAADCNIDSPLADEAQFDVRDLPDLDLDADDRQNHAAIIRQAIRQGLLTGEPAPSLTAENEAEQGLKRDPCQADTSEVPSVETLLAWVDEGVAEATDGCVVECDGVCPHGCQSWLLELGLI